MPIEKERLISLVNAAIQIQLAYDFNCKAVLQIALDAQKGKVDKNEALEEIITLTAGHEFHIMKEMMLIDREQNKWRLTHKKNERNRLWLERKRRAEGVPSRKPPSAALERNQPSISTANYLREMEQLGVSMEDAVRYAEEQQQEEVTEEPAKTTTGSPSQEAEEDADSSESDDFPPSKVHFEDSDEFALPEPDADEEVEVEGEGEGEGTGN